MKRLKEIRKQARIKKLDEVLIVLAFISVIVIAFVLGGVDKKQDNQEWVIDSNTERVLQQTIVDLKTKINTLESKPAPKINVVVYDERRKKKIYKFSDLKNNEEIYWKTECGRFVFKAFHSSVQKIH